MGAVVERNEPGPATFVFSHRHRCSQHSDYQFSDDNYGLGPTRQRFEERRIFSGSSVSVLARCLPVRPDGKIPRTLVVFSIFEVLSIEYSSTATGINDILKSDDASRPVGLSCIGRRDRPSGA